MPEPLEYNADADIYAAHRVYFCWLRRGPFDGEMIVVRAKSPPAEMVFFERLRPYRYRVSLGQPIATAGGFRVDFTLDENPRPAP